MAAFGPASLSNLGPGFDTIGLCIGGAGDVVEAWPSEVPGVHLLSGTARALPMDPDRNTAAHAAGIVFRQAQADGGIILRIRKGIPLGSGIGGSAASAAAGAWAANLLLGRPFCKPELVEAALEGEAVASGGVRHGDNVLPALFGGLVLTSAADPADYRRIRLGRPLPLAILLPRMEVLTSEARALLPEAVPFSAAVRNASDLAFVVQTLMSGAWQELGRYMMRDRLVEPVRARLLPCYEPVRKEALEAGAFACALTGSGPAMFAIAETTSLARRVLDAMQRAASGAGMLSDGFVTEADDTGVRCADD